MLSNRALDIKMPRAWYMDNSDCDQREPHRPVNAEDVSLDQLASIGVLYWKVQNLAQPLFTVFVLLCGLFLAKRVSQTMLGPSNKHTVRMPSYALYFTGRSFVDCKLL